MRRTLAVLAVLAASIAGCGSSSSPPGPQLVKVCSGLTDRCQTAPLQRLNRLARATPFPGCRVPDVSDYQRNIDWPRAKPYICGAVRKGGEGTGYGGASLFYRDWAALRHLGLWHAMYWFVRPDSCTTQAHLIIVRLQSVGYSSDRLAGPVEYDEEVPGANLTACLDAAVYRAFRRHGEVYTAPGTWPGGGHAGLWLWQAEYGSVLHPFWLPVKAWQCTDGIHGCVTYIPGIGYGDVSADRGITSQVPPTPRVHCLARSFPHTTACFRARYGYDRLERDRAKVQSRLRQHRCFSSRHPSYCRGWLWARARDDNRLATFRHLFA